MNTFLTHVKIPNGMARANLLRFKLILSAITKVNGMNLLIFALNESNKTKLNSAFIINAHQSEFSYLSFFFSKFIIVSSY